VNSAAGHIAPYARPMPPSPNFGISHISTNSHPMPPSPSPTNKNVLLMHAPCESPTHPAPGEPSGSPIGTGFAPNSDVTIHKKQVKVTHPGGP